jgi:acyl carrier protein
VDLTLINDETALVEDLRVDSARLVDIVLEIEETFKIQISDDSMDRMKTIGDVVSIIIDSSRATK